MTLHWKPLATSCCALALITTAAAQPLEGRFVQNELYTGNGRCSEGTALLVQTFELRGVDPRHLVWSVTVVDWPGSGSRPAHAHLERIEHQDDQARPVRLTCLRLQANVERRMCYRMLDVSSGRQSDPLCVTESALKPKVGVPALQPLSR